MKSNSQVRNGVLRGAHACSVLAAAFCGGELFFFEDGSVRKSDMRKFVKAECLHQHAASVRSPDL